MVTSTDLFMPKDFKLGIADADLQVVSEDVARKREDSLETMWMRYCRDRKMDTPGPAIDRYSRWKEDADLLLALGVKDYRTSVSMARTLNETGDVNEKAIDWYKQYFSYLHKNGVRIYATLYHWELPQYLYEEGGWKLPKITEIFKKHAMTVYERLGEYIEEYFILNEPRCASLVAHYLGDHAPGEHNLATALEVAHRLLYAQAEVVDELVKTNPSAKLSTALNIGPRYAKDLSDENIYAAQLLDEHKNGWFLDPVFLGKYPEALAQVYGDAMPQRFLNEAKYLKVSDKLHSLGVNYYRGDIAFASSNELGFDKMLSPEGETSDLGWGLFWEPAYRNGLYDILIQTYARYRDQGLKRIYITENGTAVDTKNKPTEDEKRIRFMNKHLHMVMQAKQIGVPVFGYFPWTFMDNFEWAEGYRSDSSFGMVYIDRKTMERIPKKSYFWYQSLIRNRVLIADA